MDLAHAIRVAAQVREELPLLIQPTNRDYALVRLLEELERRNAALSTPSEEK